MPGTESLCTAFVSELRILECSWEQYLDMSESKFGLSQAKFFFCILVHRIFDPSGQDIPRIFVDSV